ncbi:MAG TPA: UDP-N-acetylglucosamine 2-epimerase (non-hydrolyzing) [Phycisphaerae bacterium]|nr:UDP-N-acetylglucosamine 2-epimerase (non-hydrolyzing) [Phycisphaerae bacterium]
MSKPIRVITIVGARPQFVKAAAVSRAIARFNSSDTTMSHERADGARLEESIVHTGQHYDANMSQVFFDELNIPVPKHHLGVGSGSHGRQTGLMLEKIEEVLLGSRPDWVLVYGDTNSTLAGSIAAVKLHIPVAHVEAGLRSFNRRMPEEINRVAADSISDMLLCPTETAVMNLLREGVTRGVFNVGDVMYDSVLFNTALAEKQSRILETLKIEPKSYFLATLHRAENTDEPGRLESIFAAFARSTMPIILPLHPRTQKVMQGRAMRVAPHVRIIDPLPYLDILMLEKNAVGVLTDSGGMQKEAYFFGVPCVTMRDETEWVELVDAGANRLVGADTYRIFDAMAWAQAWKPAKAAASLYGDGNAGAKIVSLLAKGVRP